MTPLFKVYKKTKQMVCLRCFFDARIRNGHLNRVRDLNGELWLAFSNYQRTICTFYFIRNGALEQDALEYIFQTIPNVDNSMNSRGLHHGTRKTNETINFPGFVIVLYHIIFVKFTTNSKKTTFLETPKCALHFFTT